MAVLDTSYFLLFLLALVGIILYAKYLANVFSKDTKKYIPLSVVIPAGLTHPLTEHKPSEVELSTELYKRLYKKKIPFILEVAVHNMGEEIHFYLATPRRYLKTAQKLIESIWPTSHVTEAEEYDLLLDIPVTKSTIAIGNLKQVHPYAVPIKKAKKVAHEPFLAILQDLSKLSTIGEGAAIQWVIRPAHPQIAKDLARDIEKLQNGSFHPNRTHENFRLTPENISDLIEKINSPLFAVNARIIAGAHSDAGATTILKRLGAIIREQTKSKQYNQLDVTIPKNQDDLIRSFFENSFEENQTIILNAEEVATLFHFPGPLTRVPKLKRR